MNIIQNVVHIGYDKILLKHSYILFYNYRYLIIKYIFKLEQILV